MKPSTSGGRFAERVVDGRSADGRPERVVIYGDGSSATVKPFVRDELLRPLERFFFGRA